MQDVTWLGSTVVLVPLVVIVGLWSRNRARSWAVLAQLALSLSGAIALSNLIKPLVGRPRPHVGHPDRRRRRQVCLAVGFSRLYLDVHWPTDVLAGYALGAVWAALCSLAIRHPRDEPTEAGIPRTAGAP